MANNGGKQLPIGRTITVSGVIIVAGILVAVSVSLAWGVLVIVGGVAGFVGPLLARGPAHGTG